MMCKGHLVEAAIYTKGDQVGYELNVNDANPEVDGDMVDGTVVYVELPFDDAYIGLDLDQARAFIEACQEILSRYDT